MIKAEEMNTIGARNLAAAIVVQAARDLYYEGRRLYLLKNDPESYKFNKSRTYEIVCIGVKRKYSEARRFLLGENCQMFTDIPGYKIVEAAEKLIIKGAMEEIKTGKWPKKTILFEGENTNETLCS